MNPASIAEILLKLVQAGPIIFDSVHKLVPIATDFIDFVRHPEAVSEEKLLALHAKIDAARAELDAPIPE